MLTSLNILQPQFKSELKRKFSRLRKDKIEVYYRQAGNLKTKCIEYTQYGSKVNWQKLDKLIGAQRNRLLCNKNIELPANLGYKYFDDSEYKTRLCTNLSIKLVADLNFDVSVGIIDTKASHTALPSYLIKHTDNIVVLTEKEDVYKDVADNLLEETGAPLRIVKNIKSLELCDLIVDLSGLNDLGAIGNDALVLSCGNSYKNCGAVVVSDYMIELPSPFSSLCPEYINSTYFAGALYSVMNVYQLGSLIPQNVVSKNDVLSSKMLREMLNNMRVKT